MESHHFFTTAVLHWFDENGRELPWRNAELPTEQHAYAVWLSEIILQQTRIQQGWDYWQRFMERWPTVADLAAATEDEVLRQWQGLGYYSRARNLHHAARQIVAMGRFPDTIEGIKQLKGVGDYTAAAIGSIVFGLPAAVVDGNVYRVLSRYFGIDTPINTTEGKKEFAELAQSLLPQDQPSAFNQAMMDFGAIQCTPQSPRCLLCPLAESCVALRTGRVGELPVKLKNLKVKTRRFNYIYIRCAGETAIRRRPAGDIWQGLWEPLLIEDQQTDDQALSALSAMLTPLRSGIRHVLTHRVIIADFYLLEVAEKKQLPETVVTLLSAQGYQWVKEASIADYAVPRLVEKLLEAVNGMR
ncbi:MAG: A/G-specific adenine glycosylase [Prevotella sp.]|nr:A/G-specific adenine glycosylase [Prevotella sp.]